MNLLDFYSKRINNLSTKIIIAKKKDFNLSMLRLVLFLLIFFTIYLLVKLDNNVLLGSILSIIILLFLFIVTQSTIQLKKLNKLRTFREINQRELDCLKGNYESLDTGDCYKNPDHAFSYDLDLFGYKSLFQIINRTCLLEGSDKLASWIKNPLLDKEKIIDRQKAISELKDKIELRQNFQTIGEVNKLNSDRKISKIPDISNKLSKLTFLYPILTITLIVLGCINLIPIYFGIISFITQFTFSSIYFNRIRITELNLNKLSKQLFSYIELFKIINNEDFKSKLLTNLKSKLFNKENNSIDGLKKLKGLLNIFDQRGNLIYIVLGNGLFLIDFILLRLVNKWFKTYGNHIDNWIDYLSEINALNSLANFHFNNSEFKFPEFTEKNIVECQNMGHPLIHKNKNVKNDFKIDNLNKFYVVTGANMAGKSTFLRTVGMNLVLASIGAPVCANQFLFQPIILFTSMRTTDNLSEDISYFQAELLRLRKIMDIIEDGKESHKYFILLDEILKGTNSLDKLMGSKMFLKKLINYPVSGIVATHDLGLGELEDTQPKNFQNICFEIDMTENNVSYDYKLRKGITQNFNATFLLKSMKLV